MYKRSNEAYTIYKNTNSQIKEDYTVYKGFDYSDELTIPQIKKIKEGQKIMTDMFREFDKICRENKLVYWCVGGTFIGVVRHKGWIPFDGDIDLAMLEEDYEKFKQVTKDNKKFNSLYFIQDKKTDKNYHSKHSKIRHKFSCYENSQDGKNFHNGLMMDIFLYKHIKEENLLHSITTNFLNWKNDSIKHHPYDRVFPLNEDFYFEDIKVYMPNKYKEYSSLIDEHNYPPKMISKYRRKPHEGDIEPNQICDFHSKMYSEMYPKK